MRFGHLKYLILHIVALSFVPLAYGNEFGMQFDQYHYIDDDDLVNEHRSIFLPDLWKFQAGDDYDWAAPEFDDSSWEMVSTLLGPNQLPLIDWNGIGWFRLKLDVDESLVGVPLAMDIAVQNGASEIYINGKLMYTYGVVSADSSEEIAYQDRIPRSLVFNQSGIHVISVRFSNHQAHQFVKAGYNAGFRYLIVDLDHQISGVLKNMRTGTIHQFLFSGVLFVFTIIHILLFLFYPKLKQNLYFALFTVSFGILNYLNYEVYFSNSGLTVLAIIEMQLLLVILTMLFFLLFSYSLYYNKIPGQYWGFTIVFMVLGIVISSREGIWYERILVFVVLLFILEILRILVVAATKKRKGALVFSVGLILFMTSEIYAASVNLEYIDSVFQGSSDLASITGIIVLLITMSVSLSRSFAETNLRLESKLKEVQELSQNAIDQERQNKKREIERLLLQADNERKTNELEEARKLQLSMLPTNIPGNGRVQISARIRTASEVGGDYYDFVESGNGDLTVVIGDATGHGVKAGIIVATVKSYFKTFAGNLGLIELLRLMSEGLKNMNLRMIYMTITLLRISKDEIRIVGAGMPPCIYYDSETGEVVQILSKGMPLGSKPDYPYQEISKKVKRGDMLVMFSDGIMEAFDANRTQLGIDALSEVLKAHGTLGPDVVLDHMENLVSKWIGNQDLEDDYTVLALKFYE